MICKQGHNTDGKQHGDNEDKYNVKSIDVTLTADFLSTATQTAVSLTAELLTLKVLTEGISLMC